jgi:Septum formation
VTHRHLAAVAVLLVTLAGCGGDDAPDEPPPATTAPSRGTSVYDLLVGDCLSGLGEGQDLRVRVTPCRRRHEAEVYGAFSLPGDRFPGVEVLRQEAATTCAPIFAEYTGEPPGPGIDLAFTEIVPTLESWSSGDRAALCLALGLDGRPLRGSIRP